MCHKEKERKVELWAQVEWEMFNWIEYHVYLPVFAFAVELCEDDEYVLDDLTSSPDDRRLFFWLEVQRLFYSSQLTEVRGWHGKKLFILACIFWVE
jgi:hypothetical protein